VIAFAERIGMVPIALHKEQPGYVINTLLIPWVRAGMSLVVKGVASPHDVDRTWMIAGGGDTGPLRRAGPRRTADAVTNPHGRGRSGRRCRRRGSEMVEREYIDRNKLGSKQVRVL
jgi:3-hydroxyacyl-CoA dehydrogenase